MLTLCVDGAQRFGRSFNDVGFRVSGEGLERLHRLVERGAWPVGGLERASCSRDAYEARVFEAFGQSEVCLYSVPFRTIEEDVQDGDPFWTRQIPECAQGMGSAIQLGDFGIGSELMIAFVPERPDHEVWGMRGKWLHGPQGAWPRLRDWLRGEVWPKSSAEWVPAARTLEGFVEIVNAIRGAESSEFRDVLRRACLSPL